MPELSGISIIVSLVSTDIKFHFIKSNYKNLFKYSYLFINENDRRERNIIRE